MKPATPDTIEQQIRAAMAAGAWGDADRLGRALDRAEQARPAPQLLASALWYAEQGIPVFPLQAGGKRPATRHGVDDATTDPGRITAWWGTHPDSNIGVACGHRFDVIDIDGPTGVRSWLDNWDDLDALDRIGTVSTPRAGGTHLYVPATGRGNKAGLLPGIDYRGDGGYVVAPPSLLLAGMPGVKAAGRYRWRTPLNLAAAAREAA